MKRRHFLQLMLGAGVAPAIVPVTSLMKLWVPPADSVVVIPEYERFAFEGITLEEIIKATIRARTPALMANLQANNALLRRLR